MVKRNRLLFINGHKEEYKFRESYIPQVPFKGAVLHTDVIPLTIFVTMEYISDPLEFIFS